jgi:nucleoside permease NupC
MLVLQSILEFLTIAALAWVMSENRWCVTWNTVAAGLG